MVLFELPTLGTRLACILIFQALLAEFHHIFQPNSLKIKKIYILKTLKRPLNMKYIGINYTISQSIKFGVISKLGQPGCLFSRYDIS